MEEMDWDFAADEDFGLAKSFSKAPIGMISPMIDNQNHQNEYTDTQLVDNVFENEIRVDEFNFKLAPGVDVSTC